MTCTTALYRDITRALASIEIAPGTPDSEAVACVTGNPPRMITAAEVRAVKALAGAVR